MINNKISFKKLKNKSKMILTIIKKYNINLNND